MSGIANAGHNIRSAVFLVPSLKGGGAEFVASVWARELCEKYGIEVTVIQTHPKQRESTDSIPSGIEVLNLGGSGFASRARTLRSIMKARRFTVCVSMMPYWNLLALVAAGMIRRPPLVVISGRNMVAPMFHLRGRGFYVQQALAKLLYHRSDAFVAISHPVAAEAIALYSLDPTKVWIVPNPAADKLARPDNRLDLPRITASSAAKRSLRIVVPARLVDQKRPWIAIDVAQLICSRYNIYTTVTYFGRGPLRAELSRRADEAGINIDFKWANAWFEECSSDSVVLLPSETEGFGNVLVEAAGSGLWSVVSSRALGVADAVIPGVTGIIVPIDTTEAYAQAVLCAARRGRVDIPPGWLEGFSAESSARTLIDVVTASASRRVWREGVFR